MDCILKTENITKRFGGVTAVNSFSMELYEGEIRGIIGPNGAGKTTIFNLLSHIYDIDSGRIIFDSKDITKSTQVNVARMGLSRTFQNTRLFSGLSVLDNVKSALDYAGKYTILQALFKTPKVRREEKRISDEAYRCLEILKLGQYAKQKATSLPYGLQRRIEIARAIATHPKVLMLDEPAAGLNPDEMVGLIEFIRLIKKEFNCSILIIEHRMDVIMTLCEHIYVQNFGETIAHGTPCEIKCDPFVLKAYLGEEGESL